MSPFAKSFATQHPKVATRTFRAVFQTNVSWLNIATLALVVLLCIVYIVQVNGSISKGYQIRDLETQIQELSLSNQKLELNTQRVQSLDHVAHSVKMLGLVDAGRPEYVSAAAPSYALAN